MGAILWQEEDAKNRTNFSQENAWDDLSAPQDH